MIYLAAPYTHPNPAIREWRVQTAALYAAARRIQGEQIYCAIVECHTVERYLPGDKGAVEHWVEYNQIMMLGSDRMEILPLPGVYKSRGVQLEMDFWIANKSPVDCCYVSYWADVISSALC